jgi:hypothetical protein
MQEERLKDRKKRGRQSRKKRRGVEGKKEWAKFRSMKAEKCTY